MRLTQHGPNAAHLEQQPLQHVKLAPISFGKKFPVLAARYSKIAAASNKVIGLPSGPAGSTRAGILPIGRGPGVDFDHPSPRFSSRV